MALPDVIILYGPPASGKGTQAHLLRDSLPNYVHFDFGAALRQFVKDHLGSYGNLTEERLRELEKSNDDNIRLALHTRQIMFEGQPLEPDYLWYIIGEEILLSIKAGKKLILEGIGRTYEDGRRFGQIAFENKLEVCIFHMVIDIDTSVERAKNRHYVPNSNKPYTSYEHAMQDARADEEPWQRPEDLDENRVRDRYGLLYSKIYAKVLSTLQMESRGSLYIVDAMDNISDVHSRIMKYIKNYYQKKNKFD